MSFGRNRYSRVEKNPEGAASIRGWAGTGTTQAKFVPDPVNRVSMTRRSTPFDQQMSAR